MENCYIIVTVWLESRNKFINSLTIILCDCNFIDEESITSLPSNKTFKTSIHQSFIKITPKCLSYRSVSILWTKSQYQILFRFCYSNILSCYLCYLYRYDVLNYETNLRIKINLSRNLEDSRSRWGQKEIKYWKK